MSLSSSFGLRLSSNQFRILGFVGWIVRLPRDGLVLVILVVALFSGSQ
jgi:hypothetical protein